MVYTPDYAIHPGDSLAEALNDRHMTQGELATRTGLTEKHINQIVNGKSPITPETAIKLERVLGIPMNFWNNLQKNYEETIARINAEVIIQEELSCLVQFKNCYKELTKSNILEKITDKGGQYKQLLDFFGIGSLLYLQNTESIAYRKAPGKDIDAPTLSGRLRLGIRDFKGLSLVSYNEKKLKDALYELRDIVNIKEGFGKKAEDILKECGVGIVFSPYFSKTYVNGVARRIGDNPLIQLSTRLKSHDGLWFTLFHELGHILLHGKKSQFIEYEGDNYNNDPREKEANDFASGILIPQDKYIEYSKKNDFSVESIIAFSKSINIDCGIVAGRLAKDNHITRPTANRYRKQIALRRD